jgi:hypothetical protein
MKSLSTRKKRFLWTWFMAGAAAHSALAVEAGGPVEPWSSDALEVRTMSGAMSGTGGARLTIAGGRPFELVSVWIGSRAGGNDPGLSLAGAVRGCYGLDGDGELELELPRSLPSGAAAPWAQVQRQGRQGRWSVPVSLGSREALGAAGFQRGTVIITEFMKDPNSVSDTDGEWIELFNPHPRRVNLEGMVLSDGGTNSHTINNGGNGLFLRPGRYMVLGNNDDQVTNGGVPVRYRYTSFTLGNSSDSIILTAPNGILIDQVDYDDGVLWPDTAGSSISLRPTNLDAMDNDNPANWCHSTTPIGPLNFDTGTPRVVNDPCP